MRDYLSYLDASTFTEIRESDCALTIRDHHIVLRYTHMGARVKRWLHCGGCGLSVSRCVPSKVDCPFVLSYTKFVYEKDLLKLGTDFNVQPLSEVGPSLVVFEVRLGTWISPGASVIGCMTATLSLVCIIMPR